MNHGRYSTVDMRSRAVLAIEGGQRLGQVANAHGVDRTTLFRWVRRFAAEGHRGLERRAGSGRPRLLAAFDMEALNDVVLEPASHFGFETDLWTVGRLQHVVREHFWQDGLAGHDLAATAGREFQAILYFQDEANVSLTAFVGKTWAFRGQAPQVRVTGKRAGVTAMS